LGNNWEQQLWARSGRLFEFGNNWEQQLGTTTTGAKPSFFCRQNNGSLLDNWENNYGREAVFFLQAK
jgi:hypothetical protein